MNWDEYYKLASDLNSKFQKIDASEEAYFRCSISRVYYSVYHNVQIYLTNNGISFNVSGKDSHSNVSKALKTINPATAKDLKLLKDRRKISDYDSLKIVTDKDVTLSFCLADGILNSLGIKIP